MDQYRRKNNYETTSFEDEWIILNTDNYTITRLNETGGYCWALLEETHTIQTLSQAVAENYQQTPESVEEDLVFFLQHLIECGLIEHAVA